MYDEVKDRIGLNIFTVNQKKIKEEKESKKKKEDADKAKKEDSEKEEETKRRGFSQWKAAGIQRVQSMRLRQK